ncbi:hypothetical protein BN2497_4483 [Janthinobacterium sp. CG23_2]|nr:hypothetical protein BN2497_4483 [Janthinobacterium sp. CG23_2]CUU28639.1 hypothetical protein BN3177_4483 [Janthinobacterium sp. CG23_2]
MDMNPARAVRRGARMARFKNRPVSARASAPHQAAAARTRHPDCGKTGAAGGCIS